MGKKRAAKSESSDDSSSEEEEPVQVATKEEESGDDSGSDSSEEEAKPSPKKKAKTAPAEGFGNETGCKLFVGGLSWETDEDGVKEFFKECGEIEDVFLPKRDGQSRGFGFVTFTSADAANEGVKLNESELDGRWLNIKIAEDKPKREESSAAGPGEPQLKCFVGGLNYETDDEGLKGFFKDCGATTDVYFPTDRETGNYRGFAFVTFEDLEGSAAAVALNGEELDGRALKINYSQPKAEGGKGGKGKGKGGKGKGGKGKGKGKGGQDKPMDKHKFKEVSPDLKVFVTGIAPGVQYKELEQHFQSQGSKPVYTEVKPRNNGTGTGACSFKTADDALTAFASVNGTMLRGKPIQVDMWTKGGANKKA